MIISSKKYYRSQTDIGISFMPGCKIYPISNPKRLMEMSVLLIFKFGPDSRHSHFTKSNLD